MSSFCTANITSYDRPSSLEIMLPPVFLTLMILAALVGLILLEKWRARREVHRHYGDDHRAKIMPPDDRSNAHKQSIVEHIIGEGNFMGEFDYEVLREMDVYYNQPKQLLLICVPALLSLLFTAAIMFLFEPMMRCLWPNLSERPASINAAITCFLSPAGLVYALSFGFTFQQALEKNSSTLRKVTEELSLMDQMITMITRMNLPTQRHVMAMCKAVKSEVIFMSMLVQNREAHTFSSKAPRNIKVHVWSVLDVLRDAADHPEYMFNVNSLLVDKLLTYLLKLNSICTDRLGSLHTRIHPLMWIFLEVLGNLVLLGVIFIDAKSRRMELAMCELTIFSVSMLCYVLADLDSPFNGFFRVDLAVLPDVIKRVEYVFNQAKCAAPDPGRSIRNAKKSQKCPLGIGEKTHDENLEGKNRSEITAIKQSPPKLTSWEKSGLSGGGAKKRRVNGSSDDTEGQGSETALSMLSSETSKTQTPRAPGAHGVMGVTHAGAGAGRRSALSMETNFTDVTD